MSRTKPAECELCRQWRQVPRPRERFFYMYGVYEYDVDRARGIVGDGRAAALFPVEMCAELLVWPDKHPLREKGRRMGVIIDPEHIEHVDPNVPIILAAPPTEFCSAYFSSEPLVVIDGHHRIGRAVKEGRHSISGFVLDSCESESIVTKKDRPVL